MKDMNEDGILNHGDWGAESSFISILFSNSLPEEGTQYTNIDVTTVLRHDLFGIGGQNDTTGFCIKSQLDPYFYFIFCKFNSQTPNLIINVNPPPSPRPTITPTPTITPIPTPTQPTPTPTPGTGVQLLLPGSPFTSGRQFRLRAQCEGRPGDTEVDLYVYLEAFGDYWFYPDWTQEIQSRRVALPSDRPVVVFLADFTWPEGSYNPTNDLYFVGAMTQPGTFDIIGNIDWIQWGYY